MPKTKLQRVIFALFMSFMMVFGMESYNHIINSGSFEWRLFYIPILELIGLMVTVITLETFIGGKVSRKLAFLFINPQKSRPLIVILSVQVTMVLIMCPMMSLVASIVFKNGLNGNLIMIWIKTIVINFPIALLWQICVAGPIVRFVVSRIPF
ncbi:MAG: DUF2798 domain-containing protein [Bacteroidales bacterium]|jgi:hypothetical protein|nr:DUF2798 domain-containing protein [Bacteroidales bacterium]